MENNHNFTITKTVTLDRFFATDKYAHPVSAKLLPVKNSIYIDFEWDFSIFLDAKSYEVTDLAPQFSKPDFRLHNGSYVRVNIYGYGVYHDYHNYYG